jgi:uncharacterized membrane protein YeiB
MSDTVAPPGVPVRRRIPGIDLARALAILGMLMVHVGPTDAEGVTGTLYGLSHGRAAILFGLLAGVGVSLLASSRSTSPTQARLRLAWRAAVLLPLGLGLQLLDHGVFVILQDYSLLFLVGALVIGLGDRWVLVLAGASWLAGSVGYLWGQIAWPKAFVRDAAAWGDPGGELLHRLVLSGPYPLITWSAPFLAGVWLGRRDLRSRGVRLGLIVAGALTMVAARLVSWGLVVVAGDPGEGPGWGRLVLDEAHSQMPLWLLGATGSAVLLLGLCLWLGDAAGRWVWPLVAVGQLAFTVYVGHLLALHLERDALTTDEPGAAMVLVLGFTVAAMVLATAWRAVLPRGPLEVVLHLPAFLDGGRARSGAGGDDDRL